MYVTFAKTIEITALFEDRFVDQGVLRCDALLASVKPPNRVRKP